VIISLTPVSFAKSSLLVYVQGDHHAHSSLRDAAETCMMCTYNSLASFLVSYLPPGRAIVPAAAFCDAAAAALEQLLGNQQNLTKAQNMAATAVLRNASIPNPLLLPPTNDGAASCGIRFFH
jgi:hypothetical protein